ncbi:MAG TPA: hypothetical protein EYO61_05035 [Campylobacterales bacterium]|nr:hypothetical protein [Campylobacterales bacterium]
MIDKEKFAELLELLQFSKEGEVYKKSFEKFNCELVADFEEEKLIYPKGLQVHSSVVSNFSAPENFVVFECVHRLIEQGYNPKHIELEKEWQIGHSKKGGRADIYIKDNEDKPIIIIECKTAGREYQRAINILEGESSNQLFSYFQQAPDTKFLALYTSDLIDGKVEYQYYLINVQDNQELLANNPKLDSYRDAHSVEDKWRVWRETYDGEYSQKGLFENSEPYRIGKDKFTIDDLKVISQKEIGEKYHQFATILRKYNVSGRENSFDKLVNLLLCKVVDEISLSAKV